VRAIHNLYEGMAGLTMTDFEVHVTGGVDTHKDAHVAAALDQRGRVLGTESFPATAGGYRQLWRWLNSFGTVDTVGVEGTGAWGAGLARFLTSKSATVIEVRRGNRQHRRRHGKSDPTDAVSAARLVQSGEERGVAKTANGSVESIRLLQVARRSGLKARSQTANQIYAVIDTAPEELRSRFHGQPVRDVVAVAARFHRGDVRTPHDAAKWALRSLARRWQFLDKDLVELDGHLDELTRATAPTLVALNGAGTQTASALLIAAGDNPLRLRSSASFAALCGVSPLDASSGRQQRHRLNRGGDRQANCALYIIVISRLRWDHRTKTYMARRLAEGRTRKEVIRCLKLYVARQVHRAIITDLTARTAAPIQPSKIAA
jgi:transposase